MKHLAGNTQQKSLIFVSNSCWSMYNFRLPILQHFLQQGYVVHVVATKDDFAVMLMDEGCKVHDVVFNNRHINPYEDVKLFFQLRNIYQQIRPIYIFHYFIKPNIYGSLAAASLSIPSIPIVAGLGYAFIKKQWLLFAVKNLYKFAFRKINHIWFLNAENAAVFKQLGIVPESKIFILPSEGVDTNYFSPAVLKDKPAPFIFLMLTRMLQKKGVEVFAEAAALLIQKGYNIECRVMGFFEPHHPDTIPLQKLQKWKNRQLLHFLGFTKEVIVPLQQADCFVLPTIYNEGVPRSLLEAGSMQIPLIATNQTGCREIIDHGVNGLLCNIGSIESLATQMEKVMLMPLSQREEMGIASRAKIKTQFDIKIIINIYNNMVTA